MPVLARSFLQESGDRRCAARTSRATTPFRVDAIVPSWAVCTCFGTEVARLRDVHDKILGLHGLQR